MCTGDGWWRQRACVCVSPAACKALLYSCIFNPSAVRAAFPNLCKNNGKNKCFSLHLITQTWNSTNHLYPNKFFLRGGWGRGLSFRQFEFFILFFTWSCYCFSLIHLFWNFNSFSPFQLFPPSFYLHPLFCFLLLLWFFFCRRCNSLSVLLQMRSPPWYVPEFILVQPLKSPSCHSYRCAVFHPPQSVEPPSHMNSGPHQENQFREMSRKSSSTHTAKNQRIYSAFRK